MNWQLLTGWALLVIMLSCQQNQAQSPAPETTFKKAASFPFGAALNPNLLTSNAAYRQIAEWEYSSVTAENHLKMQLVHPVADRYDWSGSDVLVNFAEKNGQRMHGHTLVWHESVPTWVKNFQGDSTAWENLFKTHIQTVVTHYKGRIRSWDVVNEAVTDSGTLRKSVWLEHLGPDFVARAFQYAHEADPNVLLFYNDYGHEYSAAKLKRILDMVSDFKRRGIPINGLGLQMHINLRSSQQGIANAIRQSVATGLLVHISELDIAVNTAHATNFILTDELLQRQKQLFQYVVSTYRTEVPKAQQHGITTWNVGDADSWLPKFYKSPEFPLPFDTKYQKKPAYQGVLDGLR